MCPGLLQRAWLDDPLNLELSNDVGNSCVVQTFLVLALQFITVWESISEEGIKPVSALMIPPRVETGTETADELGCKYLASLSSINMVKEGEGEPSTAPIRRATTTAAHWKPRICEICVALQN